MIAVSSKTTSLIKILQLHVKRKLENSKLVENRMEMTIIQYKIHIFPTVVFSSIKSSIKIKIKNKILWVSET